MTAYTGPGVASGVQPRVVHAGSVTVKAKFDLADTLSAGGVSAGDTIQMAKVPHGAVIDDLKLMSGGTGNDTKIVVSVGDGGSATRFIGSASTSFTVNHVISLASGLGYQYDISDTDAQYDTIDLTIGTIVSATATGTITLIVTYHCDEALP